MTAAWTRAAAGAAVVGAAAAVLVWNPFAWAPVDDLLARAGWTAGADPGHAAHVHEPDAGAGAQLYTCSMHPQVIQEGPGSCPICRMDLVPLQSDPEPAGADAQLHTCSMHPQVIQEGPGSCPICRMDLVPLQPDPEPAAESGGEDRGAPRGVTVSQGFLQSFGVRTAAVERGALPIEIRTVGFLAHNEEGVFSVNTKFGGWIEEAHVNNVGEQVSAGDLLFEIYSPEMVTTQQEYLSAMQYVERLRAQGAYGDAVGRAESLLEAARERLRYWDMTPAQIDALASTREASRTIAFASPASGFIVEKMGDSLEGMRLDPGRTVLKVADHSVLWAEVEFYEHDVRHLREGQGVTVTVDAFPGRRWNGAILFFRPAMNADTRTLTAFVEVDNTDLRLRPRMFANIVVRAPGVAGALIVPADAVLHSGARAVVIVADGDGRFTPREVRLGMAGGGRQQVIEGLAAGETIVTSSQFLIDSESNLRAAIDQLLGEREAAAAAARP